MKFTYQASVYADFSYNNLGDYIEGRTVPMLSAIDGSEFFDREGYVRIGTATVEVEVFGEDQIVVQQMDALHKQLQNVRAENQKRENAILDKISKLQALTLDPA